MFLPVLLIRDMGLWGWIVFAAPNVLGAALMGWVLTSPESSRRIVENHGGACRAVSIVTIAFHVFFVLWFVPRLVGLPVASAAIALAGAFLLITFTRPGADLGAGVLVWLFSIVMCFLFLRTPASVIPPHALLPNLDALCIAPVCVVGFALCPYLDLTFHRARQAQETRGQSHFAFGAGFGLFFFLMIVFTALYAGAMTPLLTADWRAHLRPAFGRLIAAHMIVQAAFTMAVHARSLAASRVSPGGVFGMLVMGQVAIFAALAAGMLPRMFNLDPGELVYRLFMSFYGLVFPAYVWICMLPRRAGGAPGRAGLRVTVLAILIASPFYWLGFIQNRMLWLLPGLGIVLIARFMVRRDGFGAMSEIE